MHSPQEQSTLAVVAISKNEAADIEGFIHNTINFADEIIIIDDESTDDTAAIALKYKEHVQFIQHPMRSETGFAGQRCAGIERAQSDWVLNMDIDERISAPLKKEIRAAIQSTDKVAYRYKRLNYFLHRPMKAGGWNTWNRPQLAQRTRHTYKNKVHETCVIDAPSDQIGQLEAYMIHLNDDSYSERMQKSDQYSKLEAEKILLSGKRVRTHDLLLKPLITFFKLYLLRRGFRDKTSGLIAALHSASAQFRIQALAWDVQNRIPRSQIEEQI